MRIFNVLYKFVLSGLGLIISIEEKIEKMINTLQDLETTLAALSPAITQLTTDVQALLDKLSNPDTQDYSSEVAAVQAALSSIQTLDATVKATLPTSVEAPVS